MAKSGALSLPCGDASFNITKPETVPAPAGSKEGPIVCNVNTEEQLYKFCSHPVDESRVDSTIERLCREKRGTVLKPGDEDIIYPEESHWSDSEKVWYKFTVSWVDGCNTETSHDITAGDCENIYKSNCKNCMTVASFPYACTLLTLLAGNNGGYGGHHDVGCIRVDFSPDCIF